MGLAKVSHLRAVWLKHGICKRSKKVFIVIDCDQVLCAKAQFLFDMCYLAATMGLEGLQLLVSSLQRT